MIIDIEEHKDWIDKLDHIQFSEHIGDLTYQYMNDEETNSEFFNNIVDSFEYFHESRNEVEVCINIPYEKN